jgi:hypothetical protein
VNNYGLLLTGPITKKIIKYFKPKKESEMVQLQYYLLGVKTYSFSRHFFAFFYFYFLVLLWSYCQKIIGFPSNLRFEKTKACPSTCSILKDLLWSSFFLQSNMYVRFIPIRWSFSSTLFMFENLYLVEIIHVK